MAADHIDFWVTVGSTYSYLSVRRLTELQRSSGVQFLWRPFHLLIILQEMKNVPFADKLAAKNPMLANLVAIVGMRHG